jgi:hypothetical protein
MQQKILRALSNRAFQHLYIFRLYPLRNFFYFFVKIFLEKSKSPHIKVNAKTNLWDYGFCVLDNLSPTNINALAKELNNDKLLYFDPWDEEGSLFTLENLPKNTHTAYLSKENSTPLFDMISKIGEDPRILEIVESYIGVKPSIDNIDLWYSFPTSEKPKEAENFHRDTDSPKFLKLFIYLTDVDQYSGPHSYIKATHKSNKFIANKRFIEEEIYETFGHESDIKFTGKAGSNFIVDTYGIHRGLQPKTKKRILAQIRYSCHGSIFRFQGDKISSSRKLTNKLRKNYVIDYSK